MLYSRALYIKATELAQGNIGALHVLLNSPELILLCQKYNCMGEDIWRIYKDVAGGNVTEFEVSLKKGRRV